MGSQASLAVAGADGARTRGIGALVADRSGTSDTPWTNPVDGAVAEVREWLETVEAALSPYRAHSDLCRWRTGELPIPGCSPLLAEVAEAVAALEDVTDGGFRPYDRLGRFDPTGYVKGWAVERAAAILTGAGITEASIGIGGDIQMVGRANPGRPWRVAVTDPADERRIIAVVEAPGEGGAFAVATSGSAQRGDHIWSAPGRQRRGATSVDPLASITVVGPDLGRVDAFATAIWALAKDRPLNEAWTWLPDGKYQALAVLRTGEVRTTSGMATHLVRLAA
jgi:thiamine biosynthesis lipoprotein